MRAVLIANPAARRIGNEVPATLLLAWLREFGLDAELELTATPEDGERLAREAAAAGLPRVVAAGGDGTINAVLQGLAGTATELALLPLGTGNVMAHSLGLDERNLRHCCEVAARGPVRRIDLGRLNDRYFASMAGVGLDAEIALNLDPWWKQQVGRLAFCGEFFRTLLLNEPRVFRVQIGDEVIEGPMWGVMIGNTNEYTWRVRLSPEAREDDGLLDALFIHRGNFLDMVDLAVRVFFGGEMPEGHPNATVMRVAEMTIESDPPAAWQIEGDVLGQTPVHVQVVPGALKLVAPPASE